MCCREMIIDETGKDIVTALLTSVYIVYTFCIHNTVGIIISIVHNVLDKTTTDLLTGTKMT